MLITEEGSQYREKVTFDMTKKTVVHDVPAHRNISKSNVMVDFVSVRKYLGDNCKTYVC
jgi:hypothetical protein